MATAIVAAPALAALLFPARGKIVVEDDGFLDVASIDDLPADTPSKYVVTATRWDAWSRIAGVELGSVWLTRGADGRVTALSTVCPHLGCAVDFLPENRTFSCPCHASVFDYSGKTTSGPSPRSLDGLEAKVEGKRILVKYRRFLIGAREKREA